MKSLVVAALLMSAALMVPTADARPQWHQLTSGYTFEQYCKDHGKRYAGDEAAMRRALFDRKLKAVLAFNDPKHGHTYRKGINHLSDRTEAELQKLTGRLSGKGLPAPHAPLTTYEAPADMTLESFPIEFSYRGRNPEVLSGVKDQGLCGSCWSFLAAAQLESYHALKHGALFVLSVEQLTACMPNPNKCGGNGGCEGSTVQLAYTFAAENGMTSEWEYGYDSYFGQLKTCRKTEEMKTYVQPTGYTQVKINDERSTIAALLTKGPLAVSVYAFDGWFDYESGVFSGCNYANNITINHAVQVVGIGYDTATGLDYWLIRNSWGAIWGDAGYIKVRRERKPECGTCTEWDTMGGGCKGKDPSEVTACGACGILRDVSFPVFADKKE